MSIGAGLLVLYLYYLGELSNIFIISMQNVIIMLKSRQLINIRFVAKL